MTGYTDRDGDDMELVICDLDEGFVSAARECFREGRVTVVQSAIEDYLQGIDRLGTCAVHPTNIAGLLASNLDKALAAFFGPPYVEVFQQHMAGGEEKAVGTCQVLHTPMLQHATAVALAVVYPYSPGLGGEALARIVQEVTHYNNSIHFSGVHSERITRIVTPGLGTFVGNTHFAETARDMARAWYARSDVRQTLEPEGAVGDAADYTDQEAGKGKGKGKGKLQ